MAIVKMNKFTLLAFESHKEKLLEELQSFEGVQFINLQNDALIEKDESLKLLDKDSVGSKYSEYAANLSKLKFVLDFLKEYVTQASGLKALLQDKKSLSYSTLNEKIKTIDWKSTYDDLRMKEDRLNYLSNERTKIDAEINSLLPWKKFDAKFKNLKELKQTSYFIGTISKQYKEDFQNEFQDNLQNKYIEFINEDNEDLYIFALVLKEEEEKAKELFKNYGFSSLTLVYEDSPKAVIENFNIKISEIDKEVEKINTEIKTYESKIEEIQIAYEYFNNLIIRLNASENFLKSEKVIAICGWNTLDTNEELENIIKKAIGNDYYLSFTEVNEEDDVEEVPIKLKNNGFASAFESVVEMYSLPLYKEIDPTPILSIFYFLFFGMMLSDAGYGLIMVIVSSIALKKVKDTAKRNTFKLFLFAGISTVIWGAMYGGWFGDLFSNYLGIKIPYLIDPAKGITQILILSVIFGLVHIFVGLGLKAYILIRSGQLKDAIYDVLTWYFVLIGAILMLVGVASSVGKILLIIGFVGLLLTQGRSAPTLGGKIGGGIYGVYGSTSYLGDVVSYSRLLALGLATGFIANALNLIVNLIPSPFSYIISPILFVALHLFNLLVNALGSYVHTARLQYLEFFNKFYEGGGKKFTPYKLSDQYLKITK
ncbi:MULTISPECIES: V-type ATP synthase subunit I [Clostridium]|uniref:ATP synthase subunit I n=2 Tax=Clostridium TaxID=1485 RepID=A0A0D1AMR8_CLOBO|nr:MULTISPECIES: V-type ATP synthase subunit I [Clostridium]MDU2832898.1 V-type ATP synthase subunit I [Clostridium botulinum]KIS24439.1 ATP synthase subunit I [Clostridium botulinum B2 450]MCW7997253.1 V-type ATP synthase subunit I [Clostridium sp. cpc1]MDU4546399.1 V-type ATP synthase subunit I [Clostridium botulinum]MDU5011967.1 V-type ATP synthase subunit I [Clostridium botulinum]